MKSTAVALVVYYLIKILKGTIYIWRLSKTILTWCTHYTSINKPENLGSFGHLSCKRTKLNNPMDTLHNYDVTQAQTAPSSMSKEDLSLAESCAWHVHVSVPSVDLRAMGG